ncbi:uncharacterized protein At4g26485 [Cannabis sativa]|uniref:uncharacterized protein At4g26485 n=1 Tax=Cannabis sativa TaxID=3483 RepID=UPI0029CA21E6|nr:uncharacterized protein At4g26485 [Cannabis sativa]
MISSTEIKNQIGEYMNCEKILLVGEGDFSFSACLAKAFCSAKNMVATSLDTLDVLLRRYTSSESHLNELKTRGCLVLHEVNVHHMSQHPALKHMEFDVIVFNFPHAGHFCLNESNQTLIQMHKTLIRGFFRSGSKMLKEGGEIHVAHRDDNPYNKWG